MTSKPFDPCGLPSLNGPSWRIQVEKFAYFAFQSIGQLVKLKNNIDPLQALKLLNHDHRYVFLHLYEHFVLPRLILPCDQKIMAEMLLLTTGNF